MCQAFYQITIDNKSQLHVTYGGRLKYQAAIAQLVERTHGKGEVPGSIPGRGSI